MFAQQTSAGFGAIAGEGFVPSVICTGLVLFYYLAVWWMVGRDPRRGHIVSQYEPPGALSPPAIRYLRRTEFDHKALVSAVLDIAAHGCARISAEYGRFVLTRTGKNLDVLPREEQAFAGRLLKNEFIDFSEDNGEHIRSCTETLKDAVRSEVDRRFLRSNTGYFILGVVISAFVVLEIVNQVPSSKQILDWIYVVLIGAASAIAGNSLGGLNGEERRKQKVSGRAMVVVGVLALSTVSWISVQRASWALAAIAAIVAMNLLFQWLLKSPTEQGRMLIDRAEGFREFLRAVELDKFRTLYPETNVPETIDRFFPYAYALDLEHEWNERFGAAVHDAIRIRGEEGVAEGLDAADALSVVASVVLGTQASSMRAR